MLIQNVYSTCDVLVREVFIHPRKRSVLCFRVVRLPVTLSCQFPRFLTPLKCSDWCQILYRCSSGECPRTFFSNFVLEFFYGIFLRNGLSKNWKFWNLCFSKNLAEIWFVVSLRSPHKGNICIFFYFCIENYIFRLTCENRLAGVYWNTSTILLSVVIEHTVCGGNI